MTAERTTFQSKGDRVLQFWNNDVMKDIEGMAKVISDALHQTKQK